MDAPRISMQAILRALVDSNDLVDDSIRVENPSRVARDGSEGTEGGQRWLTC